MEKTAEKREISLIDIKNHVKKYADVITNMINVDVGIVDKNMRRVTGTGLYKNIEGIPALGSVYRNTLETGRTNIIENPRQHILCAECRAKENCREKLEIATPIYCRDEIVGVLGLVCFNDEQKTKIINDLNSYLNFTKQIAEFIGIKFYEYQEVALQKEREETLNQILNNMAKGVVVSDCNGVVLMVNNAAMTKLKLTNSIIGKVSKVISQNETIMNEDVFKFFIENNEYNVAGKIISLALPNNKKGNALIFDDIQKINSSIAEIANGDNTINLENIIGNSYATLHLKENIRKVAESNSTVLITGESGTGKELVARSLHSEGSRKDKPFVVINCSAIPDTLLESELFGYVKGAFTGANQNGRMGKFELANTGVIFLDEIGDMPLYLQAKILRVIQDKKIERIGSNKSIDLDIRIIAATNVDLQQKIKEQKFRSDLYYRLNVIPMTILPLRERKEDIIPIINNLIYKYNKISDKFVHTIEKDVLDALTEYNWPGNVRELENVIELMINMSSDDGVITKKMLPANILKTSKNTVSSADSVIYKEDMTLDNFQDIEKRYIETALISYGDDTEGKKYIADKMNIGLTTLYRKMKKYGIK